MDQVDNNYKGAIALVSQVVHDKRLGKTPTSRLSIAFIYGILRYDFNLSLNDVKHHYSKKYDIIYCRENIKTLAKRCGSSHGTVTNALEKLEKYGYIEKHYNRKKHVIYITLPLVIKYHLLQPEYIKKCIKQLKS